MTVSANSLTSSERSVATKPFFLFSVALCLCGHPFCLKTAKKWIRLTTTR